MLAYRDGKSSTTNPKIKCTFSNGPVQYLLYVKNTSELELK